MHSKIARLMELYTLKREIQRRAIKGKLGKRDANQLYNVLKQIFDIQYFLIPLYDKAIKNNIGKQEYARRVGEVSGLNVILTGKKYLLKLQKIIEIQGKLAKLGKFSRWQYFQELRMRRILHDDLAWVHERWATHNALEEFHSHIYIGPIKNFIRSILKPVDRELEYKPR